MFRKLNTLALFAVPLLLGTHKAKQVERLDQAAEFFECAGQLGRAIFGLQGPDQTRGLHRAELEGTGQAQQILPMLDDERGVDALAGQAIPAPGTPDATFLITWSGSGFPFRPRFLLWLLHPRRHLMRSRTYREVRARALKVWRLETCAQYVA